MGRPEVQAGHFLVDIVLVFGTFFSRIEKVSLGRSANVGVEELATSDSHRAILQLVVGADDGTYNALNHRMNGFLDPTRDGEGVKRYIILSGTP